MSRAFSRNSALFTSLVVSLPALNCFSFHRNTNSVSRLPLQNRHFHCAGKMYASRSLDFYTVNEIRTNKKYFILHSLHALFLADFCCTYQSSVNYEATYVLTQTVKFFRLRIAVEGLSIFVHYTFLKNPSPEPFKMRNVCLKHFRKLAKVYVHSTDEHLCVLSMNLVGADVIRSTFFFHD